MITITPIAVSHWDVRRLYRPASDNPSQPEVVLQLTGLDAARQEGVKVKVIARCHDEPATHFTATNGKRYVLVDAQANLEFITELKAMLPLFSGEPGCHFSNLKYTDLITLDPKANTTIDIPMPIAGDVYRGSTLINIDLSMFFGHGFREQMLLENNSASYDVTKGIATAKKSKLGQLIGIILPCLQENETILFGGMFTLLRRDNRGENLGIPSHLSSSSLYNYCRMNSNVVFVLDAKQKIVGCFASENGSNKFARLALEETRYMLAGRLENLV